MGGSNSSEKAFLRAHATQAMNLVGRTVGGGG